MLSQNISTNKHVADISVAGNQVQGDGTGDETDAGGNAVVGMCQKEDDKRKCLSTGECRICKFVAESLDGATPNEYEGCDITSDTPICDADSSDDKVQYDPPTVYDQNARSTYAPEAGDANELTPACVECRQKGKFILQRRINH